MSEDREDLVSAEEAIENAQEPLEELVEEPEEIEEQQDEVVERAKKYGHLSKEEWAAQGRDPYDWKSPEEFDKTGKILDQLYSLRKKLDRRDVEIQALVDYQERTSQREYDKAKQDLEQRLNMAKDDMDMEAVSHYSREIEKMESASQQNMMAQIEQEKEQALAAFKERNKHWFNDQNPDLMNRAIAIDQELKSVYPNATLDELAQKIETRMSYEFPDRVGGQAKPRPSMAPSQSSVNKTAKSSKSSEKTYRNLPEDLKHAYAATKRIIESQGREYPVSEFIQKLKEDGEL